LWLPYRFRSIMTKCSNSKHVFAVLLDKPFIDQQLNMVKLLSLIITRVQFGKTEQHRSVL